MQYETSLKNLRNALENGSRLEASRLMDQVLSAYQGIGKDHRAQALLQESKCLREEANVMYRKMFPEQNTEDLSSVHGRNEKQDALLDGGVAIDRGLQLSVGPTLLPMNTSDRRATEEINLEDGLQYREYAQGIMDNGMQLKLPGAKVGALQPYSPFPKYNARSRLVLQLRGGGYGDNTGYGSFKDPRLLKDQNEEREVSGAIPIIKPTIAQKMFIMLDDDYISIALVLGDCGCSFLSLAIKWSWLSLTSDIILYIMVFQQCLEIFMHSSWAKKQRMLAESDRIRILDRVHSSTHQQSHGGFENARGGAYLLPGSIGSVFVIRQRESNVKDEGAFIKLEGVPSEMYFVPWYGYEHLEIMSGLGDYLSNPVNIFNICLLIVVIAIPYINKGAKGLAVAVLVLRIFKPVFKIYNRKLKLQEAGEKTGLAGEEEEEEEEEGEEGEEHGEHAEGKEGEGEIGEGHKKEKKVKEAEPSLCC